MGKFTFIDLFAGLGGFHQAMRALGGECVFASEIDPEAAATYKANYGIDPSNDITKTDAKDIKAKKQPKGLAVCVTQAASPLILPEDRHPLRRYIWHGEY